MNRTWKGVSEDDAEVRCVSQNAMESKDQTIADRFTETAGKSCGFETWAR
ncbi:hypothetical protein RISK_003537 [Rhodopirellula islandica]|uniref:Uncharacterized protein n=1 Tax=Rhodopirellula islandica TaxID=595434 RepID=A0A0J1BD17_RHOIS|nr:hypothetical protein RISK_003537 [Rhodopirellula islandica]